MVFCGNRIGVALGRKFAVVCFRGMCVLSFLSAFGGLVNRAKGIRKEKRTAVSSVFAPGRNFSGNRNVRMKNECAGEKYRASFTVEATMVLSVVIFSLAWLIGYVYQVHDMVTGSMILQEVMVKSRNLSDEQMELQLEQYGEELGNPRLWFGEYQLEVEIGEDKNVGKADAGEWGLEMEVKPFHPGDFLRRYQVIMEMGEEAANDGNELSEGNEPKLYGDPSGNNGQ